MILNDSYIHSKHKIPYKSFNKTLQTLNVGDVLQTFITLLYYFLCYLYLLNIMIYYSELKHMIIGLGSVVEKRGCGFGKFLIKKFNDGAINNYSSKYNK